MNYIKIILITMGELSKALDEFTQISREYYIKIQQILKDNYCWKCPMRTTSKSTSCKDIDAWIRLTGAFERGIHQHLLSEDEFNNIEFVTSRYLAKVIKKHFRHLKYNKMILLKLKEDVKPYARKDDLLIIKENPESIKAGDLILWPQICPVSIYWFSKGKLAGDIPFDIINVSKSFHKDGCRYIKAENNIEIPLEYTLGKITKIIAKEDSEYSKIFQ